MNATTRPERRKATGLLLLVTVIWGWTFVWMEEAVGVGKALFPEESSVWPVVGLFVFLRFSIAAVVMPFTVKGSWKRFTPRELRRGGILALILLGGFLLQMWGLADIGAPVSAFLTSLYVIVTLIGTVFLQRRWPGHGLLLGALVATFGAGFISGPPHLNFSWGEAVTVGSAVFFGAHILCTDRFTKEDSPAALSFLSMIGTAILSVPVLLIAVAQEPHVNYADLGRLLSHPDFFWPMLLSSLLATVLALTLINFFQRYVSPVRAAIIFALEPIWASIIALMTLDTLDLDVWFFVGGGALLVGNVLAEIGRAGEKEPSAEPSVEENAR